MMLLTARSHPLQSEKFSHIASPPNLQPRWAGVQGDRLQMALLPYDEVTVCLFCCWLVWGPPEDLLSLTLIPRAPTG